MTDFLSNLVARTLGVAPTAQPIITPIYAPEPMAPDLALLPAERTRRQAPASLSLLDKQELGNSGQNEMRHSASVSQQRPDAEPPAPQRLPSATSHISQPKFLSTIEMSDRWVQSNESWAYEPQTVMSETSLADQVAPSLSGAQIQPSVPRKLSATESRSTQWLVENQQKNNDDLLPRQREAIHAPPLRPDPQAPQMIDHNKAVDLPLVAPNLINSQAALQGREATTIVEQSEPQGLATSPVAKAKRAEMRPPQPYETFQQRDATPPTIQVTIGRVEVRAVQPAVATQPRPTAAKPSLSLEEYLRTQKGGR